MLTGLCSDCYRVWRFSTISTDFAFQCGRLIWCAAAGTIEEPLSSATGRLEMEIVRCGVAHTSARCHGYMLAGRCSGCYRVWRFFTATTDFAFQCGRWIWCAAADTIEEPLSSATSRLKMEIVRCGVAHTSARCHWYMLVGR